MCQKCRQNKNESSSSNLQVAAAGEDEEDLGVVDWQQCTAGWDAAHGDIEESAWRKRTSEDVSWSYAAGAESRSVISCAIQANSECAPRRGLTADVRGFGSRVGALPLAEGGTVQSAHLEWHGWVTSPPICDILRSVSERLMTEIWIETASFNNNNSLLGRPCLLFVRHEKWKHSHKAFCFGRLQFLSVNDACSFSHHCRWQAWVTNRSYVTRGRSMRGLGRSETPN